MLARPAQSSYLEFVLKYSAHSLLNLPVQQAAYCLRTHNVTCRPSMHQFRNKIPFQLQSATPAFLVLSHCPQSIPQYVLEQRQKVPNSHPMSTAVSCHMPSDTCNLYGKLPLSLEHAVQTYPQMQGARVRNFNNILIIEGSIRVKISLQKIEVDKI